MVVTWTNKGGIFELMIDGVLQSRVTNVESNGKITGQSRFLLGGFDGESRNFVGYINSFNVWDKVGSVWQTRITYLGIGLELIRFPQLLVRSADKIGTDEIWTIYLGSPNFINPNFIRTKPKIEHSVNG